ncbi:DNA mismatch repair protein Mlh1 isoform X3 [Orussus abietinus]|nr:DNA mismatch repair protein Mlh1 isoform X3 [Orussus abietinus]
MEIVCERFTTSKLQKFEDLRSISTFGFRGEALASISHVALLTIMTKTADEKCAYKGSYIDSKLNGQLKPCAGNQGTTITIENLFYNVSTRRKALSNISEELNKIVEVVTKYAIHNPAVAFMLKKQGDLTPQIRTMYNSTKVNNIRNLYGNSIARELLEIEHAHEKYKFKMQALVTNPNYSSKRLIFLLFINHRLVESTSIRKMLEDLYSIYIPKRTHPWCYLSLEINPNNIDVNVHPTKHEVKFLHEDAIIEQIKLALDEKLANNSAARTFYMQARLPDVNIPKEVLEEILPEYQKENSGKSKKTHAREMIRTNSNDQKLDKFNFTVHSAMKHSRINSSNSEININDNRSGLINVVFSTVEHAINSNKQFEKGNEFQLERNAGNKNDKKTVSKTENNAEKEIESTDDVEDSFSGILDEPMQSIQVLKSINDTSVNYPCTSIQSDTAQVIPSVPNNIDLCESMDVYMQDKQNKMELDTGNDSTNNVANKALKRVYQYFNNGNVIDHKKKISEKNQKMYTNERITVDNILITSNKIQNERVNDVEISNVIQEQLCKGNMVQEPTTSPEQSDTLNKKENEAQNSGFKSYSVNHFRHEVKLISVLNLRKMVEDTYHQGLREILSNMTFVGCVDETSALIQSGVNLYICNTQKLAEELFYEIMLYDFANYGVIKFTEPLPLYDIAMLGLDLEEAGWTEEDGKKEDLAESVKELLLEKTDMMKEYFSVVIDKGGNLRSLPILLDKYFPSEAEIPLYILRLATEVNWKKEQPCFNDICRETARFYSRIDRNSKIYDWKYVTEHVLYAAIKGSLLPPNHFAHDSTILQIASLPNLYKVFERC